MSQRLFTRVAVVQLAYHPAILLANRSPLEDPLGTDDALRVLDDLPGKLTERLQSLRARIRQTYLGQLRKKIVAVLDFCRRSGVRLVVFPEYAVPWQLLSDVVQASDQMVVVAGTHTVDRESRKSGIYAQLGTANPMLLSAVCPVLHRGRALALQAKLNPAKPEEGQMKPGASWNPIALPDGLPGPMGALVCLDFLFRESPAHQRLVLPHLNDCRFLVVPSLTPTHTLGEFAAKAWEEARRYGRPVLYCDTAGLADKEGGGTSIFVDEGHPSDLRNFPEQVGYLDRGEEGVIVADIDLGYVRVGESTRYNWERPVRPVAAASLLYGFHPADLRYKSWRKETESLLLAEDDDAVETLSQRVEGDLEIIQNAAAIGGQSRERRLRQLVTGHARLQTIDDFQKRLREVELPDDVLPLPVLRGAMAGAVSDVLFDWQRETRDPKLAELSERLRKAAEVANKDRAERSEPGTKSIGQVRESVIGTELQRSAPTPTVIHQVRQVLPIGIDPALLGVRQANGLTLRFAASVDNLWMNSLRGLMDEPERIDGSPSTENIKIVEGLPVSEWLPAVGGLAGLKVRTPHAAAPGPKVVSSRSVSAGVPGSERMSSRHAPTPTSLDSLATLLLLARAEGRSSCAVLSIEGSDREKPFIVPRDVFVVVSVGSGWEVWFSPNDSTAKGDQTDYQRSMEELGFSPLRFVPVAAEDVAKRIRSLLSLFQAQPEKLRLRRDLKLREVSGHFVDLQVQAGDQPQPGLLALDSWLDGNEQTALLLGEFGSGKSTLLTEWCWRRAEQGISPLPVLVDLARAPATASGLDLLLWAIDIELDSKAANRTRAALELLVRQGLILPCFDGFDEMATRAGDLNPASRLSALLRVAAGGGRCIITSRDHYFSTQSELEQTTTSTLRDTLGSSAGHRILRVLPLAKGQIAELVQSTLSDAQKSQKALLRIANTYDLTDLVQRPLLLAMVLQSLDRIQPGARVAPADVYEAYVQKWLEQTREDDASLPRDQKVRFAEALAEQLWRSGEPSCTWDALRESVRNRIGQVRLPEHVPDAAAFLDVQGGAFFVREGEDRYRFAHKSFLEYFLARALVRTLPQHPEEALDTRPVTAEVASFVGELLKREGAPRTSAALRGLLQERELSDSGRSAIQSTVARANALRLLVGLARWSGDPVGWIPEGADLRGLRLWNIDLHGISLRRVWFTGTDLSGADLSDADLTEADLSMARLVGAKLSGASLDGVSAVETNFSLASADRCSLRGANLSNANLTQSVWTHCDWLDANLEGAELTRAGIWGATKLPETLVDLGVSLSGLAVVPQFAWLSVSSVAWNPQCSLLAVGHGDGTLSIWDAASGRCLATLRGHEGWVRAVGWSADGSKLVSGSDDSTVRLWDAQSGEALATLRGHEGLVLAVGWSADGSKLVSGSSDRTVRLWDAQSGEALATLRGHEGWVRAVGWSADGSKLVSGSDDSTVRLWDAQSGEALATLRGHEGLVLAVGWSADGSKLVSGSSDSTVRLWDAQSGEALATLRGHEGWVRAVGWSADGSKLVSGSDDSTVRLWDAQSGEALATLRGHEGGVRAVGWSADGSKLVSGSDDSTVRLWDAQSGEALATLRGHEGLVLAVGWSADGSKLVSGSDDSTVRLWDAQSGEALATLRGHEGLVLAVGWSADGSKLVSGSDDSTVRLWDAQSGEALATLRGHEGLVLAVGWSADGSKLVSGSSDRTVRLWDAQSGEALATLRGHEGLVLAVGWSADGSKLVSGSDDSTVRLWDAQSGEALATLRGHEGWVRAVGWSADGSKLVSGSDDSTVRLWDAQSGEALATLRGHEGLVLAVGWSADGSKLVSGSSDRTVRLWDAQSGEALATLRGHEGLVLAVGWSADGSKLVSGSSDRTVRLWDAQSGEALATLWADGTQHTALLPSGFYRSSADAEGELSLALHPARSPQSKFYLPLTGGLLTVFNRPDYVEAALTGRPPAAEQRNAELLAAGFAGGTAWDGQPHRVPAKTRSLPIEEPRDKNLSLRNPFRPGPAQDDVHHLPGRDEVLAEIHSLIESRSPAILIGPRRSGKTSILRLLNRQLSPQRRVRLLTLEGKQIGSGDDLARLLSSQLGLGAKPKRSNKTERQHLADQLQAMRPQPLFLFDEVIHLQDGDATLFPWLRALGQDLASIVYAGSPLDWVRVVQRAAKVAPGSSFGNDVTLVKLGPIAESDALRFLVDTSQGQIPEATARWVIEVCGPWPFYLQVMGHALFECIRSGQRKPLLDRGAFLDLYEQRLLSDRAAPFTGRWEELPAPVRTLLLQPESLLSRPVYLEQPQSVRRHLVDAGLCSPQGSWLADRPFFDWIRANASLLSSEP